MQCLEFRNIVWISSRLDNAEQRISKLEERLIEIFKTEAQRAKDGKIEENFNTLYDRIEWSNTCT